MLLKGNFIHYVEQNDMFTHIRTAKRWSALRKHPSKYTTLYKRRFNVSWMNVESKMLQPCVPAGACRLSLFVDGFRRIFTFSEKVTLIKIVLLPFCVPSSLNIFYLCIIRLPYWLRPLWKWSILKRIYLLPFREQILSFYRTCAPSKDSDHPAHSRSLIRIFAGAFWITKKAKCFKADNEDSNQTALIGSCSEFAFGANFRRYVYSRWGSFI